MDEFDEMFERERIKLNKRFWEEKKISREEYIKEYDRALNTCYRNKLDALMLCAQRI